MFCQNFYAISDLAQYLIKSFAGKHSWTVESYPGKVKLPGDIVRPLPNAEAVNEVSFSTFRILSKVQCDSLCTDSEDCVFA